MQVSAGSYCCGEFMSSTVFSYPKGVFFLSLWLSKESLPQEILGLGACSDIDVPFLGKYSESDFFCTWWPVCLHWLPSSTQRYFTVRSQSYTNLWVESMNLEGTLILLPFGRIIIVASSLGPKSSPTMAIFEMPCMCFLLWSWP